MYMYMYVIWHFFFFLTTGCKVAIEWKSSTKYSHLDTNNTLAELYQANAETLGVTFPPKADFIASTDMGNVSHVVPSIHVMYSIGTTAPNHSHAFTTAAATQLASEKTLIASKAMAMTAIDVLCNQGLIDKVRDDFKKSHVTSNVEWEHSQTDWAAILMYKTQVMDTDVSALG